MNNVIEYAGLCDSVMRRILVRAAPGPDLNLIGKALKYLDPHWFGRQQLGQVWRKPLASKAARLITHDRTLNRQIALRGLPPFFIPDQ